MTFMRSLEELFMCAVSTPDKALSVASKREKLVGVRGFEPPTPDTP